MAERQGYSRRQVVELGLAILGNRAVNAIPGGWYLANNSPEFYSGLPAIMIFAQNKIKSLSRNSGASVAKPSQEVPKPAQVEQKPSSKLIEIPDLGIGSDILGYLLQKYGSNYLITSGLLPDYPVYQYGNGMFNHRLILPASYGVDEVFLPNRQDLATGEISFYSNPGRLLKEPANQSIFSIDGRMLAAWNWRINTLGSPYQFDYLIRPNDNMSSNYDMGRMIISTKVDLSKVFKFSFGWANWKINKTLINDVVIPLTRG